MHLTVHQQVRDRRPEHQTGRRRERHSQQPVERAGCWRQAPDDVQDDHLGQQREQPQRGEAGRCGPPASPVPRRPGTCACSRRVKETPEKTQQQRAEDAEAARCRSPGCWNSCSTAAAESPVSPNLVMIVRADHVRLAGRGEGRDQDQQRDQRGERLRGQHDAAVDALTPGTGGRTVQRTTPRPAAPGRRGRRRGRPGCGSASASPAMPSRTAAFLVARSTSCTKPARPRLTRQRRAAYDASFSSTEDEDSSIGTS